MRWNEETAEACCEECQPNRQVHKRTKQTKKTIQKFHGKDKHKEGVTKEREIRETRMMILMMMNNQLQLTAASPVQVRVPKLVMFGM